MPGRLPSRIRAASHRQRARRIRAAGQAAGAGKVHAASQGGAAGKELPGPDPETDIEVTVDGRILTIRGERRQQDNGPCRSEFRYGSLARAVRLPARVEAADVTARYDKGVLEVSVPVRVVKPEGTRIPIENADAVPMQPPDQAG